MFNPMVITIRLEFDPIFKQKLLKSFQKSNSFEY